MVYQQHLRYIDEHDIPGDPYDLFFSDLLHQLTAWREQGDRIILMIDANEHFLRGDFTRVLHNVVGLKEVSHRALTNSGEPHTFIDGSEPIDDIWATPDLKIGGSLFSLFRKALAIIRHTSF